MKKTILIIGLLCSITFFGQEENKTSQNDDIISSFINLSNKQLIDTANYYFKRNSYDTAVVCYNLLINTIPKSAEIEHQKQLQSAYDRLANIHFLVSDFRIAYDFLIKSLLICEKYNLKAPETRIYGNIGTIYTNLNQSDLGKHYYLKSLELSKDSIEIAILLNNLGDNEIKNNNTDSAYYYLKQALNISAKINNNRPKHSIYNTLAMYYQKKKQYDSAFYYLRLSIELSKDNNDLRVETVNLSDIGKLFLEINKIDSALYYIDLSNKLAYENKFLNVIADNFHTLSKIEKSKGRYKNALELYETYTDLKDSIFNAGVYGSVNLLQRQYEVSKTNQQIEELEIDRQLKENTIHYQRIIQSIIILVLLMTGIVLLIFILQNKKLRTAYKVLYDKNVEIIRIDKKTSGKKQEIKPSTNGNDNDELLGKILKIMEDTNTYCDPSFTVDKLVTIAKSNHTYVYNAIKSSPNKSFPKLLNSYRIKEAQRIFIEEFDTKKYTIETVAEKVGFKSRSGFYDAFKQITGVSPNYYIKSMKEENVKIDEKIELPSVEM